MHITFSLRTRWEDTYRSAHISRDDRDDYDDPLGYLADEFISLDKVLFYTVIDRRDWAKCFDQLIEISNENNL